MSFQTRLYLYKYQAEMLGLKEGEYYELKPIPETLPMVRIPECLVINHWSNLDDNNLAYKLNHKLSIAKLLFAREKHNTEQAKPREKDKHPEWLKIGISGKFR